MGLVNTVRPTRKLIYHVVLVIRRPRAEEFRGVWEINLDRESVHGTRMRDKEFLEWSGFHSSVRAALRGIWI